MRKTLVLPIVTLVLASCGKGGGGVRNDKPSVTTTFITNITSNSATVAGTVVSGGGTTISDAGFQWDNTGTFTSPHDSSLGIGASNLSLTLNHLSSGTTWYVRAYATNTSGTTYANAVNFTTDTFPTNYTVSTLAGTGNSGFANGAALSSSFTSPLGVAVDRNGVLYVADGPVTTGAPTRPGYIRRIGTDGSVSTLATIGQAAQDVVTDTLGNVYDLDIDDTLYKITPAGVVTPLATGLSHPISMDIDNKGNIFVTYNQGIGKISPTGVLTPLSVPPGNYQGIGIDRNTNLIYVSIGIQMEKMDSTGNVYSNLGIPGSPGLVEIRIDKNGNVFGTDLEDHQVVQFGVLTGLTAIAGNGVSGDIDGSAARANFNAPTGLTIDAQGNIYVSDINNFKIKKLTHK